jgi:membrane fusion protein, multidrug efflux system
MIRTVRILTLALGTALVAACGGSEEQPATAQSGQGGRMGGGGPGGRVVTVEVQPVARGSIARQVVVTGTVDPLRVIGINSQAAGALLTVNVQEGDLVRQGAVLARIDDRELAAQLAAAEASFQVAEAAFQRAEQLRDRRVITLPEYERDRTAFTAAKAQVDQIRTRIGYATVRAPANGVITEKHVETGDVVGNQSRMFTLADISQLVVRVGVSELDVVDLAQGDVVSVTLDAMPNRELRGRIRRIFPVGDATTRLVPVEVVLDAQSAQLARPGFLARITFDLATSDDVLLVPVSAVLGGEGAQAVFVVESGTAIRRAVTTGLTSQGRIEIVAGLQEGEEVVVTGNNSLRDGMTVRTVGGVGDAPQMRSGAPGSAAGAPPGPAQSAVPVAQPGVAAPR